MKLALKIFLILFLVLSSIGKNYSQIGEKELLQAAQNFIENDKLFTDFSFNKKKTTPQKIFLDEQLLAYIIELEPTGFVIMPASKKIGPVVGYSVEDKFSYIENENNTLLGLIRTDLSCQFSTLNNKLTDKQKEIVEKNQKEWDDLINDKKVKSKADYQYGANLTDIWGGVNCKDESGSYVYVGNYYTPNHYSPGCVATSMSQIFHLFEWPPVGRGNHTNNDNTGSSQGVYYSAFGRKWYDWDNMLDEYDNLPSTSVQREAMGALAYQCGTAHNMDYENSGSTANISNTPNVLSDYFRFSGHHEYRSSWTDFWPRMRQNIRDGYAVQVAIKDVSSGAGHANVCDGYRYNEGDALADYYYHMNNGWWGTCNAWYRLVSSFSNCGYDAVEAGVFDILPEPMFEDEVEWDPVNSKTFTIKWNVSHKLNWEAFELEEDKDNSGTWTSISNTITDTFYLRTVPSEGVYKYRVRAKSSGVWYSDSYSEILRVPVEKIVYLNFDGDDSFFLNDNYEPEYANTTDRLDISDNWTIETWVEVDTYVSGDWDVILDRKTVFSMYLIDDEDGGGNYAISFVARDAGGAIIASVKSDVNSNIKLNEWVHIAVTRNGTTTKMFVNGKKVDESTDPDFNLSATANALNIGARYWTAYERYLDGRIDELRISTTARYDADFCPDRFYRFKRDADTRVLLHMDAFIGTEIKEYSYNFINPTLRASANDPAWASSTCPIITKEPEDMSQCEGAVSFTITAVQATSSQWQEDAGSGFMDMTDGGVYSGVTTNTLNISDIQIPTNLDGYKYRCIVTGSATNKTRDCSKEALLTVYPTCTTWTGTLWTNGEPDLTMTATIAGDYTLPYDISAKKMTILYPYNVVVPPNLTLTVQDYFENHGTITLQSGIDNIPTGALTLYGTQNNFGTMTAQRYVTVPTPGIWGNWHLICMPFEETPLIGDVFSGTYYIYKNLEPIYSWQLLSATDNMFDNEGILVQLADAGQLIEYTGNFGNGSYSQTLPLTSGTNLGWKLMKNPFPSPIDWNAASGWTRTNINGTVYTFDPVNNGGSNQYSAWDGTIGTYSGSRYINAFQGYFVQALVDGAVIATDNNVRVKNYDVSSNFLKRGTQTPQDIIKLQVTNPENKKDEIVVYSGDTENMSPNVKPFDTDAPDLFIADDYQNAVIKRFLNAEKEVIIPISLNSTVNGTYKFDVIDFNEKEFQIYLVDNYTNKTYDLSFGFNLYFQHEDATVAAKRFSLLFTNGFVDLKNINNTFFIYTHDNTINIIRENVKLAKFNLFSANGKLLTSFFSDESHTRIYNIATGIYIVKIIDEDKVIAKKVIVN